MMDVSGYEKLAEILNDAYNQSARGKGKERHNQHNRAFEDQPIMHLVRMVGLGGHIYQVMKKAQEAKGMFDKKAREAARTEMLGCIVYAAAAIVYIDEEIVKANESLQREFDPKPTTPVVDQLNKINKAHSDDIVMKHNNISSGVPGDGQT